MSDREAAKKRAQELKDLRAKHQNTVDQTQALLKEQGKIEREILKVIKEESKSVPTIASELEIPSHRVLWFLRIHIKPRSCPRAELEHTERCRKTRCRCDRAQLSPVCL